MNIKREARRIITDLQKDSTGYLAWGDEKRKYSQSGCRLMSLYDIVEAQAKFIDEASRDMGKHPKGGRPLSVETRQYAMALSKLLSRWSRYCTGRSESQEKTSQFQSKMKEAEVINREL